MFMRSLNDEYGLHMVKHSVQRVVPTKVSYTLHNSRLRLSRFQLTVMREGEANVIHEFDYGPVKIGTLMMECTIVLEDDTVSRRHCQIIREGDHYILQDLQSTNGTFIGGVRIKEAYLKPGLEFTVGQTTIVFHPVTNDVDITPSSEQRLGEIVGSDVKMREIFSVINKIANTDTTVVIEGETGTGKDVVARTIHMTSRRAKKPFIVFDCSAVPEHLIESELFGHEKGSFTGAIMAREGLFELANGGTIFLDELGELSLELQPKLLRVLENRQIRRVGSSRTTQVDVRVIAATNRRLDEEVKQGKFREDLFYRLSVVRLFLPPLRDRISDVPLLVQHLLNTASFNQNSGGLLRATHVDPTALEALCRHNWPGNVRELINVLERACSFVEGQVIRLNDLPPSLSNQQSTPSQIPVVPLTRSTPNQTHTPSYETNAPFECFKEAKERWISLFEKDYILAILKRSQYNISHAAREADIDRKYFRKLMQKYKIEVPS